MEKNVILLTKSKGSSFWKVTSSFSLMYLGLQYHLTTYLECPPGQIKTTRQTESYQVRGQKHKGT